MSEDRVRRAVRAKFDQAGSYPLQTAGTVAVGGSALPVIRGQHEVLLGGSTGIVATQFGLHNHGVTVGRLGTGIYGIAFPNMAHVRINPSVAVPTGFKCDVSVGGITGQGRIVGATGFAMLHISQPVGSTGVLLPCAPATGTVVTLDFEFSSKHQHDGNTLVPY
jgi:hypothetical protein